MAFTLSSSVFKKGGMIPVEYTQYGGNISPPLGWEGAPEGTKSFVLVIEDPDAPVGTVTHWIGYDIASGTNRLEEQVRADQIPQGLNDMGHAHYDGPKPPKGHGPHHYHFRLAALDVPTLGASAGSNAVEIKKKARGHVLAEAELIGTFEAR